MAGLPLGTVLVFRLRAAAVPTEKLFCTSAMTVHPRVFNTQHLIISLIGYLF